jgi:hypothetical protein
VSPVAGDTLGGHRGAVADFSDDVMLTWIIEEAMRTHRSF